MNSCATCVWWKRNQDWYKAGDRLLCLNPNIAVETTQDFWCKFHMGAEATEVNVPDHLRQGAPMPPNPHPVDGPVEVLIITYSKDFPWLTYALRCATKHLSGFQGITVAHPNHEVAMFAPLVEQFGVRLHGYDEIPGKGMLGHFIKMAEADLFLPASTKYFLTLDADCMFRVATTPEGYFWMDKPYWIVRRWESLITENPRDPFSKVVSDCHQWRIPTDAQLGFKSDMYTMCMNTQAMPLDMLPAYRSHIERVHRKPFAQYMLEGRNEFPQNRMDFTALGAFAYRFFRNRFHWFDVMKPPFPQDRKRAYWSHGGITPVIREEIERFLK